MTDSDTLITDAEAWLDLRAGDTCTVRGKLDSIAFNNDGLTIGFADWSTMAIDTPEGGCLAMFEDTKIADPTVPAANAKKLTSNSSWLKPIIPLNTTVSVRCRRTEDGLLGLAIWVEGGVPIPLVAELP